MFAHCLSSIDLFTSQAKFGYTFVKWVKEVLINRSVCSFGASLCPLIHRLCGVYGHGAFMAVTFKCHLHETVTLLHSPCLMVPFKKEVASLVWLYRGDMSGVKPTIRLRVFKVSFFFLMCLVSCSASFPLLQMICQWAEVWNFQCVRKKILKEETKHPVKIRAPSWWCFKHGSFSLTVMITAPNLFSLLLEHVYKIRKRL